jgi:hypothetical protein
MRTLPFRKTVLPLPLGEGRGEGMRPTVRLALLSALLLAPAAHAAAPQRPTQLVKLQRAPAIDGVLKEAQATRGLAPLRTAPAASPLRVYAAWHATSLYLAADVRGEPGKAAVPIELALFFPGAGPTAPGLRLRIAPDGQVQGMDDTGAAEPAPAGVKAATKASAAGLGLEVAVPARALPRFPATGPLALDLCLTLESSGDAEQHPSTCAGGAMVGGPVQLPDAFRAALGLRPPKDVLTLEGRPGGWLGYGELPVPLWVQADSPLTQQSLGRLVAGQPADARAARVNVPEQLRLPDGRILFSVLSGKDPYARDGQCNAAQELRVGLFLVKGNTARRVLDWPASSCALGRVLSMQLGEGDSDAPGALTMGYSNGATVNFAWSGDHFERTELGSR